MDLKVPEKLYHPVKALRQKFATKETKKKEKFEFSLYISISVKDFLMYKFSLFRSYIELVLFLHGNCRVTPTFSLFLYVFFRLFLPPSFPTKLLGLLHPRQHPRLC